jgi:predicted nucleic acid-binding protein
MNFEVHTTDFIIDEYYRGKKKEKNLKNINKYMRSGKIEVHVYDYNKIFTLHEQKKSLTASDCSIYILSREIKAILLTGDRKLKLFSEKGDVEVHGIIWLIDKMHHNGVIDNIEYKEKLIELKSLSKRLPIEEIDRRLK